MKELSSKSRPDAGFTLIELMIVVAILGIIITPVMGMYMNAKRFNEDHLLFTRATAAMVRQAEIIKNTPYKDFQIGVAEGLDPDVTQLLNELPDGGGSLEVTSLKGQPRIKRVVIRVHWNNPWETKKSIHTVILRAAP